MSMEENYRKGIVLIRGEKAGMIEETDEGYRFTYDPAYCEKEGAVAASLTLPLRTQPYFSEVLFPFFDGLIPEGWLLHMTQEIWKLDRRDRFGVLLSACRDCIGDVSITTEE